MLNDIRILKILRQAIAGSSMPIRRIGFGFKDEPPRNFLDFEMSSSISFHGKSACRRFARKDFRAHASGLGGGQQCQEYKKSSPLQKLQGARNIHAVPPYFFFASRQKTRQVQSNPRL
jgi:hypothetical protein